MIKTNRPKPSLRARVATGAAVVAAVAGMALAANPQAVPTTAQLSKSAITCETAAQAYEQFAANSVADAPGGQAWNSIGTPAATLPVCK